MQSRSQQFPFFKVDADVDGGGRVGGSIGVDQGGGCEPAEHRRRLLSPCLQARAPLIRILILLARAALNPDPRPPRPPRPCLSHPYHYPYAPSGLSSGPCPPNLYPYPPRPCPSYPYPYPCPPSCLSSGPCTPYPYPYPCPYPPACVSSRPRTFLILIPIRVFTPVPPSSSSRGTSFRPFLWLTVTGL
eukprot:3496428-Rhodomonas_salina.1